MAKLKDRIKAKQAQIDETLDKSQAIVDLIEKEDRDLTAEEREQSTALIAEADGYKEELDALQALDRTVDMRLPAAGSQDGESTGDDERGRLSNLVGSGGVHTHPTGAEIHRTCLRIQPRHFKGTIGDYNPQERAYRFGMWGLALAAKFLPHRYSFPKATAYVENRIQMASHAEASGGTGAHYTVPEEFSSDLIDLKETRGVVRRLFGRESMMSDVKRVPRRTGGLTGYWVEENGAGTESTMTLDDIELVAKKLMAIARMSKELDEDNAIGFGDTLAREIAYTFADKEDEAGINGDGTSTYGRIMGARTRLQDVDGAGTDSFGLVTGAGNLYSELTLANFYSVVSKLPQYAMGGASWLMSTTFYWVVVEPLVTAVNGAQSFEVRQGPGIARPIFLGFPVDFSQVMPATEANSQVCAMLGDWGQAATLGDRRSESIEFSDQVYVNSQSVWERDQIAVKGTERLDINVHEFGTSAVSGSYVGLQTAAS